MLIHSNRVKIWTQFLFKYSPDNNYNYHGLGTININQLAWFPSKMEFAISSYISAFNLFSVPFSLESWVTLLPLIQQKITYIIYTAGIDFLRNMHKAHFSKGEKKGMEHSTKFHQVSELKIEQHRRPVAIPLLGLESRQHWKDYNGAPLIVGIFAEGFHWLIFLMICSLGSRISFTGRFPILYPQGAC